MHMQTPLAGNCKQPLTIKMCVVFNTQISIFSCKHKVHITQSSQLTSSLLRTCMNFQIILVIINSELLSSQSESPGTNQLPLSTIVTMSDTLISNSHAGITWCGHFTACISSKSRHQVCSASSKDVH